MDARAVRRERDSPSGAIRQQLRGLGVAPRRALGQHFLVDASVVLASVQAAQLSRNDTVLEIGGGLGVLTAALAAVAGRVIVVERDALLAAHLERRFAPAENVQVVTGDVFRVRLTDYLRDGQYHLVANLPYQVTARVFRNFLTLPPRPRQLVVLVQKEVADRLAGRGTNRGLLWLLAAAASEVEVLRTVDRRSFVPPPQVTSALVRLRLHPRLPEDVEALLALGRSAFSGRRKQLKNSLAAGLHQPVPPVVSALQAAGLDPAARPQDLGLPDWRKLRQRLIDDGLLK